MKSKVDAGYPYPISKGWAGIPDDIDAVTTDFKYNTLFFKGQLVYKFDDVLRNVAQGYPKKIRDVFPGLVNNIDTAFRSYFDGNMYFFKDTNYWKWNDSSKHADGPFLINSRWKNVCTE